MQPIAIRFSQEDLEALDGFITAGRFENRTEALRLALKRLLHTERERVIVQEFREAYTRQPDGESINGEVLLGEGWTQEDEDLIPPEHRT